ncbi:uncharacterized protein [Maniola hyperantus]|uniref:uncharacterized protein n=1 Tax=Aphantopus hyperantus TaxID=2795564 RepID=UPI00156A1F1F|nr:uncharacterized protein LOC117990264 [Maniola hyperantus]
MEVNITPVAPNRARKRIRDPAHWKRNIKKRERYMPKNLPNLSISCTHKSKLMNCSKLTSQDLRKFREAFYSKPEKNFQDNFILKYMKVKVPSRKKRGERKRGELICHTRLYIRQFQKPYTIMQVCQKLFKRVLSITEHRIRTIAKNYYTSGKPPQENRGGDRTSIKNVGKKTAVMQFIESFKCIESHYCRSATSVRKYVPSELNIRKMWRMYNQKCDEHLKVRQCFFRNIFNRSYNIGFVTPRVDVCSKCLSFTERIKHEQDSTKKAHLIGELRLHKLKAKCFHRFLKEYDPSRLTISFDCQKNQVLPKVPDQSAYYSRQLYIYNFTIVKGNETQNISKENVYINCWTENTHRKSSNEIASALYFFLKIVTWKAKSSKINGRWLWLSK